MPWLRAQLWGGVQGVIWLLSYLAAGAEGRDACAGLLHSPVAHLPGACLPHPQPHSGLGAMSVWATGSRRSRGSGGN